MSNLKKQNRKFTYLFIFILLTLAILIANVFAVSVMGHHLYTGNNIKDQAESIHVSSKVLHAKRGRILDSNGSVLATDTQTYDLVAILSKTRLNTDQSPAYVVDKKLTADLVAPIIGMEPQAMYEAMNVDLYQIQFGNYSRRLSYSQKTQIEELGLPGLVFYNSFDRQYPLGLLSRNLIGMASYNQDTLESIGQFGLEQLYNTELTGVNGKQVFQQSRYGYIIDDSTIQETPSINGQDIYLTLDQSIQEQLDNALAHVTDQFNATNLFGIVAEVETGKILAMSQLPRFNPNAQDGSESTYMNYNTSSLFEPGSVFKTFTWASAIDKGAYSGDTKVNSNVFYPGYDENGHLTRLNYNAGHGVITNAYDRNYGEISYDEGFIRSSNPVSSQIVVNMGDEYFQEKIKEFGFTQPIETDKIVTSTGHMNFNYAIERANVSFGQGITVNPMQMIQAYTAILNDGIMVKPYIIDKIVDTSNQTVTYQSSTQILSQPIKQATSAKMIELMRNCVILEAGTCRKYNIEDSEIIAKTGTAEVVIDGKYSTTDNIHSVVAALPYNDPKVVVYFGYQANLIDSYSDDQAGLKSLFNLLAIRYDSNRGSTQTQTHNLQIAEVPNLVNHTLDFASASLANSGFDVITIGDGNQVIQQLPLSYQDILSNQRVLLLTSKDNWTMPDMTNWALKDITNFWSLTNVQVTTTGSGRVTAQSIPAGTPINTDTKISVRLR